MVRAILEGRKTVTRRVVKPNPAGDGSKPEPLAKRHGYWNTWGDDYVYRQPYLTSDILYVLEPWKCRKRPNTSTLSYEVVFKDGSIINFQFADRKRFDKWRKYWDKPDNQWQSPYFMPREAARIFLRVTSVWVERLQDMTIEDSLREGVKLSVKGCVAGEPPLTPFALVWDSTIKKADRPLYGWEANPWVWVLTFERISKEEARHASTPAS